MSSLLEVLQFKLGNISPGETPLSNKISPTKSGLNWLAIPCTSTCVPVSTTFGLAYKVDGGRTLQAISVSTTTATEDAREKHAIEILSSVDLGCFVVNIAASSDGRLIAVACADGSLRCYNMTTNTSGGEESSLSLSHRWTISEAHSHVVSDISKSPSSRRELAAGKSGPVRSLHFSPVIGSYVLVLVDINGRGLSIYNADSMNAPQEIIQGRLASGRSAASATWCTKKVMDNSSITIPTTMNSGPSQLLAVGNSDGSIHIHKYNVLEAEIEEIAQFSFPGDKDEDDGDESWVCTHLDWNCLSSSSLNENYLVAGYCRVKAEEEDSDNDDDGEDEDDEAEHDAQMFIAHIQSDKDDTLFSVSNWMELGDIVPFFAVPKSGRHVFFTSFAQTTANTFLIAATNVASEIAVICHQHQNSNVWDIVDIQEGSNATTPTDDDDEYTYPVGIAFISVPESDINGAHDSVSQQPHLLVAATDGTLSNFKFLHAENPNFFTTCATTAAIANTSASANSLVPDIPVELKMKKTPTSLSSDTTQPPELATEPPVPSSSTFGFTGSLPSKTSTSTTATGTSMSNFGSMFGKPSTLGQHQQSKTSIFGSTFGQPSALGNSQPVSAAFSFGSPTSQPIFGSPKASSPEKNQPIFGSTTTSFVSSSSSGGSAGGFAALAASAASNTAGGGFGFGATKPTVGLATGAGGGFGFGVTKDIQASSGSLTGATLPSASSSSDKAPSFSFGNTAFGSNQAIPVFGSGSKAPLFGSITSSSPGIGDNSSSPFNIFGNSSPESSAIPSSMVRPLFGVQASNATKQADPVKEKLDVSSNETKVRGVEIKAPTSTAEQKTEAADAATSTVDIERKKIASANAERVFDSFCENQKDGHVTVSVLEDMLEELGEGFHGDELEKQIQLIDPTSSGNIEKVLFINWYVNLVSESFQKKAKEDDDSSSLDSEERAEREEEKQKAKDAFMSLAKEEGGVHVIEISNFKDLIERMGTTYCEEEHIRTIKKIGGASGKIILNDFIQWYMDWLFGDEDSDYSEEDGVAAEQAAATSERPESSGGGWGNIFRVDKDSWKCESCMVRNDTSFTKCPACDTPRPGCDEENTEKKHQSGSASTGSSAIGAGGFTFGGAVKTTTTTEGAGFSFGANPGLKAGTSAFSDEKIKKSGTTSSMSSGTGMIGSGGFTFPAGGTGSPSKGGFSFGGVQTSVGGLSLSSSIPVASKSGTEMKDTNDKTTKGASSSGSAFTFGIGPVASGGLQFGSPNKASTESTSTSNEDKQSAGQTGPEANAAARVFDSFDDTKSGSLPTSAFDDMLDELGEGFHGEELEKQIKLVDPKGSGRLDRSAFIRWYVNLVQGPGGNDSDDASIDSEERAEREEEKEKAKSAFLSLAQEEEGVHAIKTSDFKDLFEKMGTTYCEEEHQRTIKKLERPGGKITLDDFVQWYMDWLFGDDEDSDYDEEDGADDKLDVSKPGASSEKEKSGWGNMFKVDKDSWKCESCMVRNDSGVTKCPACDTPRPGYDGKPEQKSEKKSTASSGAGIGTGGFTFGGGLSKGTESGFFISSTATSGFGSDFQTSNSGRESGSPKFNFAQGSVSGGFMFGGNSASSTGFSFGTSTTSSDAKESSTSESGIGNSKFSFPGGSGSTSGFSFGSLSASLDSASKTATTKAPAPFSGGSKAADSSYPPISSKAPTPFSGVKPSGSSYPPISSKAPTPFNGEAITPDALSATAKPSSTSYPPLSKKAPTPFSGVSKPADTSYPPLSSKAPTPFGGVLKPANTSYPPISSTAPTPFSGMSKPADASYPPISSKAPTPFGGVSKPADTSYPPLSSKAPTPFGGVSKPADTSYPPLSSKAPTPFGGVSKPADSSYPPLSSQAPTPFGGASKPADTSYPPLSSKTPTPFGAAAKPSGTSCPPLSSKAPTPFGAAAKPSGTSYPPLSTAPTSFGGVSKPSDTSYPPLSTKAPTPFGGASKPADTSYPPLSSKAPIPFGGTAKASSTSHPPLSTKAPTPFAGAAKPSDTSYPPLSTKAPTPFGGAAKPSDTSYPPLSAKAPKPFGEGSKPADISYPPISSKAPTPFGGVSKPADTSYPPLSSKAPTPFGGVAKPSSTSYPPLSTKAPTPFGGVSKPADTSYPPLTKAPTPFSGTSKTTPASTTPFSTTDLTSSMKTAANITSSTSSLFPPVGKNAAFHANTAFPSGASQNSEAYGPTKTGNVRSVQSTAGSPSRSMSECEAAFFSVARKLNENLFKTARSRPSLTNEKASFQTPIENIVNEVQRMRISCSEIEEHLLKHKHWSAFLFSRNSDASRQATEARQLIDEHRSSQLRDQPDLLQTQPLDRESEENRRQLASKAVQVDRYLKMFEERANQMDAISLVGAPEGKKALFRGLVTSWQSMLRFEEESNRIERKVSEISKSIPNSSPRPTIHSGASSSRALSGCRERIEPLPIPATYLSSTGKKPAKVGSGDQRLGSRNRWHAIQSSLHQIASRATSRQELPCRALVSTSPTKNSLVPKQTNTSKEVSFAKVDGSRGPSSSESLRNANLFSPPMGLKSRSGWETVSVVDQARVKQMSISLPRDLPEVTFNTAARQALASFGTTPEKVKENIGVTQRAASQIKSADVQGATKGAEKERIRRKEASKSSGVAAFPPIPRDAPTPVSQKIGKETPQATNSLSSITKKSLTALPGGDAMSPFLSEKVETQRLRGELTEKGKTNGDMSFSTFLDRSPLKESSSQDRKASTPIGSKSPSKSNTPSGLEQPMPSDSSIPDYNKLLTSFYQNHNPDKIREVAKTLEKYKGREGEMFSKLSQKYRVPNPLESSEHAGALGLKSNTTAFSNFSLGGASDGKDPGQSGFTGKPPLAPSPFSSASAKGNLTSPNLFGKAMSTPGPTFGSPGLSSPSPSPFGNASLPTSIQQSQPFGTVTNQPSPAAPSTSQPSNSGRSPRDMLVAFYHQYNAAKVAEVDKLLGKYKGNEEQMFRNLAKKYNLDPSYFGLSATPAATTFGSPSAMQSPPTGFGQPSPLGGGATFGGGAAPTPFGSAAGGTVPTPFGSAAGGAAPTPFGSAASGAAPTPFGSAAPGGFGQPSALGQGVSSGFGGTASSSPGHAFGATSSPGFGANSFGSLANASTPTPFGGGAPSGFGSASTGFGSASTGFGAMPTSQFGSTTPFGAPRR